MKYTIIELLSFAESLEKIWDVKLELARLKKTKYASRLKYLHPGVALIQKKQRLADAEDTLRQLMEKRMEGNRHRLALCAERIRGRLLRVEKLGKGFAYVEQTENEKKQL